MITSNEVVGTTARLGVLRLGASRLAAIPDANNLKAGGRYAWERKDSGVKRGDPPGSVESGWTTGRV